MALEFIVAKSDQYILHAFPPPSFLPPVLIFTCIQEFVLVSFTQEPFHRVPTLCQAVLGAGTQRRTEGRPGPCPGGAQVQRRCYDGPVQFSSHIWPWGWMQLFPLHPWIWALVVEEKTLVLVPRMRTVRLA